MKRELHAVRTGRLTRARRCRELLACSLAEAAERFYAAPWLYRSALRGHP